mmetsp:Transcript_95022/g.150213  ORF Transcript_95022/g.150213 Transcript_95022/m.150213 type:complete len:268 (+) Transcript_95022:771-1574(+)
MRHDQLRGDLILWQEPSSQCRRLPNTQQLHDMVYCHLHHCNSSKNLVSHHLWSKMGLHDHIYFLRIQLVIPSHTHLVLFLGAILVRSAYFHTDGLARLGFHHHHALEWRRIPKKLVGATHTKTIKFDPTLAIGAHHLCQKRHRRDFGFGIVLRSGFLEDRSFQDLGKEDPIFAPRPRIQRLVCFDAHGVHGRDFVLFVGMLDHDLLPDETKAWSFQLHRMACMMNSMGRLRWPQLLLANAFYLLLLLSILRMLAINFMSIRCLSIIP